jgi:hypothetical protein
MQKLFSFQAGVSLQLARVLWRSATIMVMVTVAHTLPAQNLVAESEQSASSSAGRSKGHIHYVAPTAGDISRAYMNCLIEVDKTMSVLAGHANLKAVHAEADSQRAFCENRKRDCRVKLDSPECRTFISEFEHSEVVDGAPLKGR